MARDQKKQPEFSAGDFLIRKTSGNGNIVVTKKTATKAVDRNRIKRIIKEALRALNIDQGKFQIIIRRNIAKLKTHQIKTVIEKQFKNEK